MRHHLQFLRVVFAAIALCFTFTTAGLAQEETAASITGQVTDSTGAVIQGASVVVTNKDTNSERRVQTNEDGNYVVTPLIPGSYTVTVQQTNFKRYVQTVTLNAKDRRGIDVVLEAGDITQTVLVTDEAPILQESPTTQSLISGAQVRELPLNNRENFLAPKSAQGLPACNLLTRCIIATSTTATAR